MTSKKNRLSYSFLMTCNIFVILKVYPVNDMQKVPSNTVTSQTSQNIHPSFRWKIHTFFLY